LPKNSWLKPKKALPQALAGRPHGGISGLGQRCGGLWPCPTITGEVARALKHITELLMGKAAITDLDPLASKSDLDPFAKKTDLDPLAKKDELNQVSSKIDLTKSELEKQLLMKKDKKV
jgi:hypothetical protein